MGKIIKIQDVSVTIVEQNDNDYICLTDMIRDQENNHVIISNWLRKKDTIEFLGIWEELNNPNFKLIEFDEFRNNAGTNRFSISPKQWIEKTSAIGLIVKSGKYGGTYAHKDIAFEFGAWLSPMFKLLLIKEFQRLKDAEMLKLQSQWDFKRLLSKVNYRIQTDAIKDHLIPISKYPESMQFLVYAEEADILNMAVFGMTAKQWKEQNGALILQGINNLRDTADAHQLVVLSNLESHNSVLIRGAFTKPERFKILREEALRQLSSLAKLPSFKPKFELPTSSATSIITPPKGNKPKK
jgi:hypothetical protein